MILVLLILESGHSHKSTWPIIGHNNINHVMSCTQCHTVPPQFSYGDRLAHVVWYKGSEFE
jgi:hypothetical protein